MAPVDIYGSVASTSSADGVLDFINPSYLPQLQALLPPGPAWTQQPDTELTNTLEAAGYGLARVERRGLDLLEEIDPRTTVELLPDWERVAGLVATGTLVERQTALHVKLTGRGGQHEQFYVALALTAGYAVAIVRHPYSEYTVGSTAHADYGSPCSDPLTQGAWMFVWWVFHLPHTDDTALEKAFTDRAQNHTCVAFQPLGKTWTARDSLFGAQIIRVAAYGNNVFVVAGSAGLLSSSLDADEWKAQTSQFGASHIYCGLFVDGLFAIGGDAGKLSTSADGLTWVARVSQFGAASIRCIIKGDIFVATGAAGNLSTSADGLAWVARVSQFGASMINWAAYGDSTYVAVGDAGKLSISTDSGATWTLKTSQFGASAINRIAFGNSVFIAVGDDGKLSISTDGGLTWALKTSQFGASHIQSVIFAGGVFVAVGNAGKLSVSTDNGETWVAKTSQFGADVIRTIAAASELLIAAGDAGKLSTSIDSGATWVARTSNAGANILRAITQGDYSFVVGGNAGKLSTSPYTEI